MPLSAKTDEIEFFVHGTTVGLNAVLTRSGARVALLTTQQFPATSTRSRGTTGARSFRFGGTSPNRLVPLENTFTARRADCLRRRSRRTAQFGRCRSIRGRGRGRRFRIDCHLLSLSPSRTRSTSWRRRRSCAEAFAGHRHCPVASRFAGMARIRTYLDDGHGQLPGAGRARLPATAGLTRMGDRHAGGSSPACDGVKWRSYVNCRRQAPRRYKRYLSGPVGRRNRRPSPCGFHREKKPHLHRHGRHVV